MSIRGSITIYGTRDRLLRGAAIRLESELGTGDVDRDVEEYATVGR